VHVSFGLSEEAAKKTIIGITFLRAGRSTMFMANDGNETLVSQEFGST
jgi:hypothetical protein